MPGTHKGKNRETKTGWLSADMEHCGPERALTVKVSDSVTVGNQVLPLCYLGCSCSPRGKEDVLCVCACDGTWVMKALYDPLKPLHSDKGCL